MITRPAGATSTRPTDSVTVSGFCRDFRHKSAHDHGAAVAGRRSLSSGAVRSGAVSGAGVGMIADAVRALRDKCARVVVGIDGPGASGKSTAASELAGLVGGFVVHGDDFYRPRAGRPDRGADGFAYDLRRLQRQILVPARQRIPIQFEVYDWAEDTLGSRIVVPDNVPVIVEGVYTTRTDLAEFYDYRVVVWAPRNVRFARGLARDGESARQKWVAEWMPAEDHYFAHDRPQDRADLMIRTAGAE